MNPGSVVDLITPGNPQPRDGHFSHNHTTRMIEPLSAEVGPNNSTPNPWLSTPTYLHSNWSQMQVHVGVAN